MNTLYVVALALAVTPAARTRCWPANFSGRQKRLAR